MIFNAHSDIRGAHAFFSASNYHWIRYDIEKMRSVYANHLATIRGTQLHDLACNCIRLGQNLPNTKKTMSLYVNDALGYHMIPEQPLYFSRNFWGTADAISFRRKLLRISDLKTGMSPASMDQLKVYAALFCLEYGIKPEKIGTEFRIYQNDEVRFEEGNPEEIGEIMNKVVVFDHEADKMREEGGFTYEDDIEE